MTKILAISDLHLEFEPFRDILPEADILILAGDIYTKGRSFKSLFSGFKGEIIRILGNHEFYDMNFLSAVNKYREIDKENGIHFLEKEVVILDGISFFGTTLWTSFKTHKDDSLFQIKENASHCVGSRYSARINDFQKIKVFDNHFRKFSPLIASEEHQKSLHWLKTSLESSETTYNVVITHHAPSRLSLSQKDAENKFSVAYANCLDDFILEQSPDLWIHGHIHKSCDYKIGKTRVICNPRGYSPDHLNPNFSLIPFEIKKS